MKRIVMVVLAMLGVAGVAMAAGKVESANGKLAPATTPAAVLKQLERAYETKSIDALARLYTSDYIFHTTQASIAEYMTGFDRAHELESAGNLFNGMYQDGKLLSPGARTISMHAREVTENTDPEHADSTDFYRVVSTKLDFKMVVSEKEALWSTPSRQVFYLVRGDAAVLSDGQPANPNQWYIRRWLDDLGAVETQLAAQEGDCGQTATSAANLTPGPGVLAVRALANPACPALEVMCDVPGTEPVHVDVFDVTGRLANQREIAVKNAGALKVEAGAGANLSPGVYWVRLRQAKLKPSTRMVVVAK